MRFTRSTWLSLLILAVVFGMAGYTVYLVLAVADHWSDRALSTLVTDGEDARERAQFRAEHGLPPELRDALCAAADAPPPPATSDPEVLRAWRVDNGAALARLDSLLDADTPPHGVAPAAAATGQDDAAGDAVATGTDPISPLPAPEVTPELPEPFAPCAARLNRFLNASHEAAAWGEDPLPEHLDRVLRHLRLARYTALEADSAADMAASLAVTSAATAQVAALLAASDKARTQEAILSKRMFERLLLDLRQVPAPWETMGRAARGRALRLAHDMETRDMASLSLRDKVLLWGPTLDAVFRMAEAKNQPWTARSMSGSTIAEAFQSYAGPLDVEGEASMAMPTLSRVLAVQKSLAEVLLRVAVRCHELDHGIPPTYAEDLVPDYLDAVPRDPTTGNPLLPLLVPPVAPGARSKA